MNNLSRVQKKNKTTKLSAYWCFVMEYKKKMLKQGHRFHSDEELRQMASKPWSQLSDIQKERYKTNAKTHEPIVNKSRKIYNSLGQVIEEVEEAKKKEQEKNLKMLQEIKSLVEEANDEGELDSQVFHFLSTSSFYEGNEGTFPAELAMSKFSLREGIIDDFQIRINPGKLPMGAHDTADKRSKSSHRYPLPPKCPGQTDYMEVLNQMIKFLHPMDKLPIFFTDGNLYSHNITVLNETRKVMKKIFYESEEDDVLSDLKIYPIDELFFNMQKVTVITKNQQNGTNLAPFTSVHAAALAFEGSDFHYSTIGCDFHMDQDVTQHCCLSKVRRFGYMFSKWCSNGKKYQLIEGKHCPEGFEPTN